MSAESPGPRVPAADTSEDVLRQIEQELSAILNILEGRFLHLVKEGGRGAIPPEAVVDELSFLSRDLTACFRRLGEIEERGDLSFRTARELQEIDQRCVWLSRKIRLQEVLEPRPFTAAQPSHLCDLLSNMPGAGVLMDRTAWPVG